MTNRLYEGRETTTGHVITADGTPLDPRFDLRNHSPTGFSVGYSGSGPAQAALAILADATGDDDLAQRLYQRFKFDVIAGLDRDQWLLTQAEVRSWIASILRSEPEGDD